MDVDYVATSPGASKQTIIPSPNPKYAHKEYLSEYRAQKIHVIRYGVQVVLYRMLEVFSRMTDEGAGGGG